MTDRNIRILSVLLFILSALLAFGGYILMFPEYFGLTSQLSDCLMAPWNEIECLSIYGLSIGEPLYRSMMYVAPTFLLLAIFPNAFSAWTKFGLWALPLFIGIVWITPVMGQPFAGVPSRDFVATRLSQLFLLISLLIIAYSWWRSSASKEQSSESSD